MPATCDCPSDPSEWWLTRRFRSPSPYCAVSSPLEVASCAPTSSSLGTRRGGGCLAQGLARTAGRVPSRSSSDARCLVRPSGRDPQTALPSLQSRASDRPAECALPPVGGTYSPDTFRNPGTPEPPIPEVLSPQVSSPLSGHSPQMATARRRSARDSSAVTCSAHCTQSSLCRHDWIRRVPSGLSETVNVSPWGSKWKW
jgi:hypothetical protein